jgi:hypothetical protein
MFSCFSTLYSNTAAVPVLGLAMSSAAKRLSASRSANSGASSLRLLLLLAVSPLALQVLRLGGGSEKLRRRRMLLDLLLLSFWNRIGTGVPGVQQCCQTERVFGWKSEGTDRLVGPEGRCQTTGTSAALPQLQLKDPIQEGLKTNSFNRAFEARGLRSGDRGHRSTPVTTPPPQIGTCH